MDIKDNKLNEGIKPEQPIRQEFKGNTENKNPKKPKRKILLVIISIVTLFLGGFAFLVYKGYIFSKDLGFKFNTQSFLNSEKKELDKDSSGRYTNALLVGLDTRENGGLLNTDTIIIVSYDHEENRVVMISVPRDFHVETAKDSTWYSRINSIYSSAEQKEQGTGIVALRESVERVTGLEIQYYATVDFKAFVEIVDTLGGIDINVENSFTDYLYPSGDKYKTVSFKAGPQTMDGETALTYARSRHSQQNNEGTDFARARRQQKVIIALQEKILSSESLTNPKTLMGLLSSISGNLRFSEFTLDDVEAAFDLAKNFDLKDGKTYSFVLDPSIAGYSLIEKKDMESGAYAIGPKLGLGIYDDILDFVKYLKENPAIYAENAKIIAYDTGLGFKSSKELVDELNEDFPYLNIIFAGTINKEKEGIIVYTKEEGFEETTNTLRDALKTDITEKPEYITSNLNGEDVTILLGKALEVEDEKTN